MFSAIFIFTFEITFLDFRRSINQSHMVKNTIFPIWVLFMVLAIGCKKSNNDSVVVNTASQELFPNQIGDKWHYLVIDTTFGGSQDSSVTQYFVDVTIVDTAKILNGISATVWQFKYPDHTDSQYVYQSGDTINFYGNSLGAYRFGLYIFPFVSGTFWEYVSSIPTLPQYVTVTGPADITVSKNLFPGAWRISGPAGGPDTAFSIDNWFENHVGFVKIYFNSYGEFLNVRHNLDWYLINYQLK